MASLRDSEALPNQVSAITSKQDSLQAFPKEGKRKGEELKAQLLRKIVPARGAHISEAFGLSWIVDETRIGLKHEIQLYNYAVCPKDLARACSSPNGAGTTR